MTTAERVRRELTGRDFRGHTLASLSRYLSKKLDVPVVTVKGQLHREGVTAESLKLSSSSEEAMMRVKVWDIETTGLKADISSLLVSAFLDTQTGIIDSMTILDFDGDWDDKERQLYFWTREQMLETDMLIGHNTKAFDRNFMNGLTFRMNASPIPERYHLDTYLIARYGAKGIFQSNSLSNLGDVLGVGEKDKPNKEDWRLANSGDPVAMQRLRQRCEEDCRLNAAVWARLKPYWLLWQCKR